MTAAPEHPPHHRRPVARRLPRCRRSSGRQDAQPRPPGGDGTYFARHYAQAAPCGPSRACLYTGLYQMNNRVVRNGTPLDARHDTIALAMRRLGYQPTLFGYTDQAVDPRTVPPDSPWLRTYEGILPGFDVARPTAGGSAALVRVAASSGASPRRPISGTSTRRSGGSTGRPTNAPPRLRRRRHRDGVPHRRIPVVARASRDAAPWFAHVSYLRPHPPFIVPEPFNTMFDPDERAALSPRRRHAAAEAAVHPLVDYWLRTTRRGLALHHRRRARPRRRLVR